MHLGDAQILVSGSPPPVRPMADRQSHLAPEVRAYVSRAAPFSGFKPVANCNDAQLAETQNRVLPVTIKVKIYRIGARARRRGNRLLYRNQSARAMDPIEFLIGSGYTRRWHHSCLRIPGLSRYLLWHGSSVSALTLVLVLLSPFRSWLGLATRSFWMLF